MTSEEHPCLEHLSGGVAGTQRLGISTSSYERTPSVSWTVLIRKTKQTDLFLELQRIAQCIECQFRTAANYEEFHLRNNRRFTHSLMVRSRFRVT